MKLLQVNYRLNIPREQFEGRFEHIATEIAKVPGLRWKLWMHNAVDARGGGIYLFEDDAALTAFLAGPIIASLKAHPDFSEVEIATFELLEDFSAMTRAPLG